MREDFLQAIRGVWAKLELGEPKVVDPRHVRLRIEGFGIDLTDSGAGKLLVEGVAGRFPSDPAQASRLVRRVLETNLGLLLGSQASVFVKTLPGGDKGLSVRATYSLGTSDTDLLIKKIEDVLASMEYYAAEFKLPARSSRRPAAAVPDVFEQTIIFRP